MQIIKPMQEKEEFASIAVRVSTRDRFNNLVEMLNHGNKKMLGDKAKKITRDDVLNELLNAYSNVE